MLLLLLTSNCIGNPLDENNHVGPLIDTDAVAMRARVVEEGGKTC
jgi:aldehyde dehydrogenase (NAD+)